MSESNTSKWLGGPKFLKVRRGSSVSAGGKHSGPAKTRRFMADLAKALAANRARIRKQNG